MSHYDRTDGTTYRQRNCPHSAENMKELGDGQYYCSACRSRFTVDAQPTDVTSSASPIDTGRSTVGSSAVW